MHRPYTWPAAAAVTLRLLLYSVCLKVGGFRYILEFISLLLCSLPFEVNEFNINYYIHPITSP